VQLDIWDENLVMCSFYVKNCIFEHMTDTLFPWPPISLRKPCPTFPQAGGGGCSQLLFKLPASNLVGT